VEPSLLEDFLMATGAAVAAVISAVAMAASAGYQAYSANEQGKAQQRLANYNAAIAEQDAMVAERDARLAANEKRRENQRFLAKQRALYAKAGVVGTTGSPLLVQAETAGELERNALAIDIAGQNQGRALRQQSVLERFTGASARKAGRMNAIGAGISGVAGVASAATSYYGGKIG
jgi:hypothetical protein